MSPHTMIISPQINIIPLKGYKKDESNRPCPNTCPTQYSYDNEQQSITTIPLS